MRIKLSEQIGQFPSMKDQTWLSSHLRTLKKADLVAFTQHEFQRWDNESLIPSIRDVHGFVFYNGVAIESTIPDEWKPFVTISHHDATQAKRLEDMPSTLAPCHVVIALPRDTLMTSPLIIHHVVDVEDHVMTSTQIEVSIASSAKASISELWTIPRASKPFVFSSKKISLADNAHLHWDVVALEGHAIMQEWQQISLNHSAVLEGVHVETKQGVSRLRQQIDLCEDAARCNVARAVYAHGAAKLCYVSEVNHLASHTSSEHESKVIVTDQAEGLCDLLAFADKNLAQLEAHQLIQTFVLSQDAHMHAHPRLEIHTDDIKASHGAGFGHIDKNVMHFGESRGIGEPQMRSLLLRAHLRSVVDQLHHEKLRELALSHLRTL